jgi:ubiquitin-conjugating enzyme E2 J2
MLSEEITAGGMQASDYDRRLYAKRSHAWNIEQKVFRTAFPEVRPFTTYDRIFAYLGHQYSEEKMKDLPNMGEKERGVSDAIPKPAVTPVSSTYASNETELRRPARRDTVKAHQQGTGDGVHTWASTLRRIVLEKWRWGAFLVIAILVSRYST